MVNRNTKYWFFTWEINSVQRKLPSKEKLKSFLDQIADYAQFQEEIGESGPRISKKKLLDTFKDNFKNIGGLTFSNRMLWEKKNV